MTKGYARTNETARAKVLCGRAVVLSCVLLCFFEVLRALLTAVSPGVTVTTRAQPFPVGDLWQRTKVGRAWVLVAATW